MDRFFSDMSPADSALLKEYALPRSSPLEDKKFLLVHPTVLSKQSVAALELSADYLRQQRMVPQSFFFRWKAHILRLCLESSVEEFFARLSIEGEVERIMRQLSGPEATHLADILAGVGKEDVSQSSSLSAQIDDDGVTHARKQQEAEAQRKRTSTPVEMFLLLRDEWESKWREVFQSQVAALAADEAVIQAQLETLVTDETRKPELTQKMAAAHADIDKCEKAKQAAKNRMAPALISLFDLLLPEFTEHGTLEVEDVLHLAIKGKDLRENDATYGRVQSAERPSVVSRNELTQLLTQHCYHVPVVLQLLSPASDPFVAILRRFRVQCLTLFAAAYLEVIGVPLSKR